MEYGEVRHPQHHDHDEMIVSKKRLTIFLWALILIAVLGLAAAGYAFYQVSSVKTELTTLKDSRAQTKGQLIEEVGKLIILPEGEEPTIATVVDPELLRDQVFFKDAKAGDRVLIYAKDSRAILYDPVAKKVVQIGFLGGGSSDAGLAP